MADSQPSIVLLLVFCSLVQGQLPAEPVTEACVGCICEAISGCDRTLQCDGNACGPFQITRAYWNDTGRSEATDVYQRCTTDPACAAQTVFQYMNKYAQDCNGDARIDCYDYSRIHLKGGTGCARPFDYDYAIKYENKFRNCYQRFKQSRK